MSTRIRRARIDDLPALLDLLDELQEGATPGIPWDRGDALWTATVWEEVLTDPRRVYIVAEEDERVVGTVDLIIVPNLSRQGRPYALVENVVVDASDRGHGHGEHLMRHIIDEARAAGCYKISLTSALRRENAHRFYGRLGFRFTHKGFRLDL